MASNVLKKIFESFKGLDLRTSDLLRAEDSATQLQNMTYRQTGAMNKRKGYQWSGIDGGGGYGITTYNNVDLETGIVTEEVISIDDDLQRLTTYSFTITYTATANSNTYYTLFLNDSSTFEFNLYDNGTLVLTSDLGVGNEGTPVEVGDLTTAINGITNFTCTAASGAGTSPAAIIPISIRTNINTTAEVSFEDFSIVPPPANFTTPFTEFYAERTDSNFENATFSEISDVLYIATGHNNLMKYDGNRVYRAGISQHPEAGATDAAAGTAFAIGEVHSYLAVYEYTDAKQNIITGVTSPVSTHTNVANKDIDVTTTPLDDYEFNIDQCVINGTQVGVTNVVVDDSSTMQVNDFVYVNNTATGDIESIKITAVPDATHITLESAVNVTDNDAISTVKISLFRTEDHSATPTSPGLFYLTKEFVNDVTAGPTAYTDSLSDVNLSGNAQFVEPIKSHGLPPKCKYIDDWRTQLIMSGDKENVSTVYYSDIDSPEYFPAFDNSFIVDRKVTGLKALDNVLYIFKAKSIDGVTGDLAADSFQRDPLSREGVGCAAHATIQEVQGSLMFLSSRGVYSINNEGLTHVGSAIEPRFDITSTFSFKQASAYIWQAEKKYCLFMPTIASGDSFATDATSETYVYDYFRQAWLQWSNYNLMGGMTEKNGIIYKHSRDDLADLNSQLHKILQNSNAYDYADHTAAISFIYKSPWITLGEPSVWKKFLRCKIHNYDTTVNDFENDTFSIRLQTEHDYNDATQYTDLIYDFSGGGVGWGVWDWGQVPWGEVRLSQVQRKMASKKVRSLRVIITNSTVYENILVSGLEFQVALPYRADTIKE